MANGTVRYGKFGKGFSRTYSRNLSHVAFIGVGTYDFVLPTQGNVQPENTPAENYTIIL